MNDLNLGQRIIITDNILYGHIIPSGSVGHIIGNPFDSVYRVKVYHENEYKHLTLHRKLLIPV